jgi:hypothetical protein
MAYTIEQLGADIRKALKEDFGPRGKQAACIPLSKALLDEELVARHLTPQECRPRKVLYEDTELGFCICGHVYQGAANGPPHDHGPAWAIYGVAEGDTEMTDWRIVQDGEESKFGLVEAIRTYVMKPGDCHLYDVGAVHSPKRAAPITKLIRVEGKNLDTVTQRLFKAV